MTKTELSTEALLDRRELAEKAAKRMPFEVARIVLCMGEEEREGNHKDEDDFLTSNDPNTVIATIDELLRLREDNERLEKEADWLAERLAKYCVDDAEKECPLIDVCPEGSCPTITTSSWREVAHRAVEE